MIVPVIAICTWKEIMSAEFMKKNTYCTQGTFLKIRYNFLHLDEDVWELFIFLNMNAVAMLPVVAS